MNERVIFDAALEIVDPSARRVFIEKACAGNPEQLAAVEALLKSHVEAGSFLEVPAAKQIAQSPVDASTTDDKTRISSPDAGIEENAQDGPQNDLSFLQPSSKPGSIGLLGHYEVLQVLGQGAFGVVFKAFDEKLHRMVAIKVMNPALAATSPPRKRFLREARSSAAVRHENIVAIHAVEEQPIPYLVMEYIPGQTLQRYLDEHGPLDPLDVLKFGQQIAAGLAAAHAQGLIHRDIKPANILLDTSIEARIKITDFGLARAVDDASMTQSGLIAGTPMYMAPEQARGQILDHRADLFSLGTVLYTMASGRPPFRASNTIAVLKRVCEDTPRPVSEVIPGSPIWLDKIIAKLHAKEPEGRFQSAKEVSDLLAKYLINPPQTRPVVDPGHGVTGLRSPVAPRQESRTSIDAARADNPQVTDNVLRAPGLPVAERQGYVKPNRSRWLIATTGVALLLVIAALIVMRRNGKDIVDLASQPSEERQPSGSSTNPQSLTPNPSAGWHGWPSDVPAPAIAPFDAVQAKKHQEDWATYLKVPVEYTNSIGMKFRLIPPGEFLMGSTDSEVSRELQSLEMRAPNDSTWPPFIRSETPAHRVVLTQPVYLGTHEVTQEQYERVTGKNPADFSANGAGRSAVAGLDTSRHPVEQVSWNDAAEYCAMLSNEVNLRPLYFRSGEAVTPLKGDGYRLPTEAEWEFACRAGTQTKFWCGDDKATLRQVAWFNENSGKRTHPVGELAANPFGLFDAHGNVWEWCQDSWEPNYYRQFANQTAVDPTGPSTLTTPRVCRGAFWFGVLDGSRSTMRYAVAPEFSYDSIGFRLALTVEGVRKLLKVDGPKLPTTSRDVASSGKATGWHGWPADAPAPAIAPFDAAQAKKHQEEWAAYLKLPVEYINSLGMKFRLIPPGEFLMGSTAAEIEVALKDVDLKDKHWQEYIKSEAPQHKVILTQAIYLGVNEVTQKEYEAVMQATPSHFASTGPGKDAVANLETQNHPVETVSWNDAAEFCAKLSQKEELKPFYFRAGETITPLEGTGYRLPTEAEWEFACRAGTTTKYWIGDKDDELVRAGWFGGSSGGRTHAAGELKANPLGLYDMHGNVWEWVEDAWELTYYGQLVEQSAINPNGPSSAGSRRVVRGGHWHGTASFCQSAIRYAYDPPSRNNIVGFRVSLLADAVKESLKRQGVAGGRAAPPSSEAPIDFAAERKAAE